MSTRLVSIDVEPGGVERPAGYIGVTVLDGARVVESTLYRFLRPDVLYTWDDWCASMRVRALQQWMRMDEAERDELRWVGGDALVESDPEMARILNEYPSERHEPEPFRPAPAPFAAVWPEVAAIVQSGYVAAYGARYDRRQLHELIGLAGLTQPALEWLDGMEAIRHLAPLGWDDPGHDIDVEMAIEAFTDGGNTLGAQMVRHGFLDGDTAGRRWALHISHRIGAKAVAWDAAEDARLNALIFQRVIEEHGSIEAAIATLGLHVKPHTKAPSHGGQR